MRRYLDFDKVAKANGYKDKIELFSDYGFIPTVLIPNHKKFELILLCFKFIKGKT